MKIEKIKKSKNGQYKIFLSNNEELLIYEDVLIENNLLTKKEIDKEILKKIEEDNGYATSYIAALKYINIRLRSKKEISDYLLKKGIDEKVVNQTTKKLREQGYINDTKFIKAFINDKIIMTNWGPYKIKKELERYGIDYRRDINDIIPKDILESRVERIVKKLIKINKYSSIFMLKNKVLIYLINIGYSRESVISYIDSIKIDNEDDRYKKEYDKLYSKYKSKYSKDQLEKIIKNKLYQKGFKYNDYS